MILPEDVIPRSCDFSSEEEVVQVHLKVPLKERTRYKTHLHATQTVPAPGRVSLRTFPRATDRSRWLPGSSSVRADVDV